MCGIIAIICSRPADNLVAAEIHEALYLLQHRGRMLSFILLAIL